MKDIAIRMRFVFAPNFRKAVALHLGQETATADDIKGLIGALVEEWERDLESDYYNARAAGRVK